MASDPRDHRLQRLTTRTDAVYFSDTLSSLHRPPSLAPSLRPQLANNASIDCLSSLDHGVLFHLLSFLPSHEFFLRLPKLSCLYHRLFTEPALHRQHGRQRFGVSQLQWAQLSSQAWPSLSLPIWSYSDDMRSRAPLQPQQPQPAGEKDWALESIRLYQHTRFACLYLLRHAPNVTSAGLPIVYHLPRALRCLIIDRLTAAHAFPSAAGLKSDSVSDRVSLLSLDYSCFRPPEAAASSSSASASPALTDSCPVDARWLSGREHLRPEPVPSLRSSLAMESAAVEQAAGRQPLQPANVEAELTAAFARRRPDTRGMIDAALTQQLQEVAVISSGGPSPQAQLSFTALWYGAALRQALASAAARPTSAAHSAVSVEVWLDSAPVVAHDGSEEPPLLLACDCAHWLRAGCDQRGLMRRELSRIRQWMGDEASEEQETAAQGGEGDAMGQRLESRSVCATRRSAHRMMSIHAARCIELDLDRRRRLDTEEGRALMAQWTRYLQRVAATWPEEENKDRRADRGEAELRFALPVQRP